MLAKAKNLNGYTLKCLDGELGQVREFYFDDARWTIRYLIVDTENLLKEKLVLISPYALIAVTHEKRQIAIKLTMKQIQESPLLNTDQPVSQQFEADYHTYFGWPLYWTETFPSGPYPFIPTFQDPITGFNPGGKPWDYNLRSTNEVSGYHLEASDGGIGHIDDFFIDEDTWTIRYLIIDTQNWWPGKRILIVPTWIDRISWSDSKVYLDFTREKIKKAPEYTEETMLTREYETGLYKHYDMQGYWDNK